MEYSIHGEEGLKIYPSLAALILAFTLKNMYMLPLSTCDLVYILIKSASNCDDIFGPLPGIMTSYEHNLSKY